jgi:hypothetical protein
LEKRLRELNNWLSFHISPSPSVEKFDDEAKDERNHSSSRGKSNTGHRGGRGPGGSGGESKAGPVKENGYESDLDSLGATHDVLKGKGSGPKGTEGHPFTGKRCTITCFNPDGSPLQGTLPPTMLRESESARRCSSMCCIYEWSDVIRCMRCDKMVKCCAVLCCDMLYSAVLCCAVLCCAVICCTALCCAVICCTVL